MTAEKGVTTCFQRDTKLLHDLQIYQADVVDPKIDAWLGITFSSDFLMELCKFNYNYNCHCPDSGTVCLEIVSDNHKPSQLHANVNWTESHST